MRPNAQEMRKKCANALQEFRKPQIPWACVTTGALVVAARGVSQSQVGAIVRLLSVEWPSLYCVLYSRMLPSHILGGSGG